MSPIARKPLQKGVTLIELIMSIVIISIAMVAMLSAFSSTVRFGSDPVFLNKAMKLSQLYIEEILSKKYDEATPDGGFPPLPSPSCASLGPDTGESRSNFDDVDDYDGLNDNPPVSLIGTLDSSYDAYRVEVDITCVGNSFGASGAEHVKRIAVIITLPNGKTMPFDAYRGNY